MTSIRRRLLWWLLTIILLATGVAALLVHRRAETEANAMFDRHLSEVAITLLDQRFEDEEILGTLDQESQYDLVVQVWTTDGVRRYASRSHADLPRPTHAGHETVRMREGDWRVFSLVDDDLIVQVSQPVRIRQQLAAGVALRTVMPLLLLLPVLGVAIWFIVGRGLRPLAAVADAVGQRNPSSLDPLPETDLPDELRPVVSELNALLGRLGKAFDAQRAFTADAAHELRTPLTALQLQLELAQRANSPEERDLALRRLEGGIRRAVHLVQQLLTIARQDPDGVDRPRMPLDLNAVVKEALGRQADLAAHRDIDLGLTRDDPLRIEGDGDAVGILVNNLVDNAIRYTPAGGRVDVSLQENGDRAMLEVRDTGPGIPPEERERVFGRFYRHANADIEGSGLGLSIVRNIAERHHATVALLDPPEGSGLCVQVSFPRIDLP